MNNILSDELKRLSRRIESLQKTCDLLYQDRNILEDILSRLSTFEEVIRLSKEHQSDIQKDLKADIGEIQAKVEDNIQDVKNEVKEITKDTRTIVLKKGLFDKIQSIFKKKEEVN